MLHHPSQKEPVPLIPSAETTKHGSQWRRVVSAAAVCALSLSLAGSTPRAGATAGIKPSHAASSEGGGLPLRQIENMPGWGQVVNQALQKSLQAATVELGVLQNNGTIEPTCTAAKIQVGNEAEVLTARHCMTSFIPNRSGKTNEGAGRPVILDVNTPIAKRTTQPPMGYVSAFSVDPNSPGTDWALLKVAANPASPTLFNSIPAINASALLANRPLPGAQAVLYGAPQVNHFEPERQTGIYLGEFSLEGMPGTTIDPVKLSHSFNLVTVPYIKERPFACTPGSSGSEAMTANGTLLGPLSTSAVVATPTKYRALQ